MNTEAWIILAIACGALIVGVIFLIRFLKLKEQPQSDNAKKTSPKERSLLATIISFVVAVWSGLGVGLFLLKNVKWKSYSMLLNVGFWTITTGIFGFIYYFTKGKDLGPWFEDKKVKTITIVSLCSVLFIGGAILIFLFIKFSFFNMH
jgi:hypothetical protein